MMTDPALIQEALRAMGAIHVQVMEYRTTLGYPHLRLMGSSFLNVKGNLYLGNCYYISGETLVGPCKVELRREEDKNQEVVVITTTPDMLKVKGFHPSLTGPGESEKSPDAQAP